MLNRRFGWLAVVVAFAAVVPMNSRAGDATWNNGSTDFLWNTTSVNWTGAAWNNNTFDGAIFGATGIGSINVPGPISVRSVNFSSAGYTLGGAGSLNFTLAGTSTLGGSQISTTAGITTINTSINSIFGINKLGAGNLILSAAGAGITGGTQAINNNGVNANIFVGAGTTTTGAGVLTLANSTAVPTSTVMALGSGNVDIGANNVTLARLIYANTNASAGTTGQFNGTGTLTVSGDIQVIGNATGFGNQLAAPLNIGAGTQMFRIGSGGNGSRELVVTGAISGSGNLFKTTFVGTTGLTNSFGGFSLYGNNTYTGTTTLSGSTTVGSNLVIGTNTSSMLTISAAGVALRGANASYGSVSSVNIISGGTLTLDNAGAVAASTNLPPVAAANLNNRINPAANLNLDNGFYQLIAQTTGTSSQTLANLSANSGYSRVSLDATATGLTSQSHTGNLTIAPGATVLFRGLNLPTITTGTAQITFAGTTPAAVGGIMVGAVGANTNTSNGTDFVRYDATRGIARLDVADYNTADFSGGNVSRSAAGAVAANSTINSLRSTASLTTTLNANLTVTTGMVLSTTSTHTISGTGTLDFGTAPGYFFTAGSITVNSPITGTGGLIKATDANTLTLAPATGSLVGVTGGITVQGGTLSLGANSTNFDGSLNVQNGTATFTVADAGTGAVNIGQAVVPGQASISTATVNIAAAAITSFSRNINVLGNGGNAATTSALAVSTAAGVTQNISGPISLGNNLTTTGTGTATTIVNLSGPITGNGGLFNTWTLGTINVTNPGNNFNGELFQSSTATMNLAGSANAGTGGTTVQAGVLRVAAANNLGSGPVTILGGTLQTDAAINFAQSFNVHGTTTTLATGVNNVGIANLNGSSLGTLTKTGSGALTISGSGDYNGAMTFGTGAGSLTLSGNGAMPRLGNLSMGNSTVLNINDSSTPLARTGRTANLTLTNGGVAGASPIVNLTTNAGGSTFDLGSLSVTGGVVANPNSSALNVLDGGAGTNAINFLNLTGILANNTLNIVGTPNLGLDVAGPSSRIFFATAPTLSGGVIPGVNFTGFGGSGQATYDPALGVILFAQTFGAVIDNIGPPNTATNTNFVTNAATTANLGATIKSLTVAGHVVTMMPGIYGPLPGPQPTGNQNAPTDSLVLSTGNLISSTLPSSITSATASTVLFGSTGTAQANITTTTDLTIDPNVTLNTTGGLLKSGAGTLVINSGSNGILGAYNITAGGLTLNSIGGNTAASVTGLAGTTVTIGTGSNLNLNGATGATFTHAGALAGSGALTTGAGFTNVQVLTGASATYTGQITINGGTITAANAAAFGAATNPAVIVNAGGTVALQGTIALNALPMTLNGVGATGRNGALDNISGTNTYAGAITLAGNTTIGATTGSLTLSGGLTGAGIPTFNVATGATVSLTTVALNIGVNNLVKTGGGIVVLPNLANTMANQDVNGGFMQAAADNNLGANTNIMNLNGGGFRYGAAFAMDPLRPIVLGAAHGSIDTNTFSPSLAVPIGGVGNLTKTGTGTLTLSGANTYGGSTNVINGTLTLGANNTLPVGTALTVGDVTLSNLLGAFAMGGFNQSVASLSVVASSGATTRLTGIGTMTVNGPISYIQNAVDPTLDFPVTIGTAAQTVFDLGAAVRTVNVAANANTNDLVIAGVIQNGGINYVGTSPAGSVPGLQFTAANTFNGGLTVSSGALNVSATGTLGAITNALTINANGIAGPGTNSVVSLSSAQTIGSLSGTRVGTATSTLNVAAATTLTIDQAANTSFDGVIAGATGAVTKAGVGHLTLAGINTYGGATTINGGKLSVTGSTAAASAVTVNAGGILAGTGVVNGPITVNPGGTIEVGNTPGIFSIGAGITFGGGTFEVELQGLTPGTQYDQLLVTGGNVALGASVTSLSLLISGYTPALSDSFVVVSNTGAGTLTGTFAGFPDQSIVASNVLGSGIDYLIYYGTYSGFPTSVVIAPVPEPATVLALCAAGAGAFGLIRRRLKKGKTTELAV